jgi:transcriptional regulator with XRE-family HTH domain
MTNVCRARRSGANVIAGRRRADAVATRLGVGLREARQSAGMRQTDAVGAAGISQTRLSELERGLGARATLETWACVAAAVGEQLVGFLEAAPGASPPRDIEHLRRQAALIELASRGGWQALPELAIDTGVVRSRSVDVTLVRQAVREAVVGEIWDWFDDVGAALRSIDGKRYAVRTYLARFEPAPADSAWKIACLFVVRRTRQNERLVSELRPLFAARFPGSASQWLGALTDSRVPLPVGDGLLWSTKDAVLKASRLGVRTATVRP